MVARKLLVTGLAGALAGACGSQSAAPVPSAAAAAGYSLEDAVKAARADAGRRTGTAAGALVLLSAETVTWSDGSLGCPQPDAAYTQALAPGYRVRLRGPAGEMDYHASARGALVLCPAGRALDPLPGVGRI
jgi:hypothetical protein